MGVATTTASDLLAAADAGDPVAREQLVARHLDTVRAVCGRRLASPHDVDDAVQETFLRALSHLDQVEDAEALGAWLRAVAVRVCADHGRRVGRTIVVADAGADTIASDRSPLDAAIASDDARRLRAHLAELSERDRRALWLRDAIGLPVPEVAQALGVTEGSARVLLTRARNRLRAAYRGVAGVVLLLVARVRQRVAGFEASVPIDLQAALAVQLALVVTLGLAPRPAGPVADPTGEGAAVADVQPAAPVPADTGLGPPADDAVVVDAAAGTVAGDADEPPPPRPPAPQRPLLVAGEGEPDAPPGVVIGTSDGDGDVAELTLFGGSLLGDEGDEGDEGDDGDRGDTGGASDRDGEGDGDGSDREQVGPVEVVVPEPAPALADPLAVHDSD